MTTETDLLPLSKWRFWDDDVREEIQFYARANVAHAVAPLQAEVEALRAEVERLKALVRSVGYETLDRAEQAEAHADNLAEALREAADMLLADYPETSKRLRATLNPAAAQEEEGE